MSFTLVEPPGALEGALNVTAQATSLSVVGRAEEVI